MCPDPTPPGDGDAPEGSKKHDEGAVVAIAEHGDIVLDVTFKTSARTLRQSRQMLLASNGRSGSQTMPLEALRRTVKVAYRVSVAMLSKHSQYFACLLSNPRFREASLIADAHKGLAARGIEPAQADVGDLPSISIVDDDEATEAAGRQDVFEDMLRIMHHKPMAKTAMVLMPYVATLAIVADRFDCAAVVSRALSKHKFSWPATRTWPWMDEQGRPTNAEKVVRQKILVAWLVDHPLRLQQATRELIVRGSSLWSVSHDAKADLMMNAAWWSLPDGLERELEYRRECIMKTIASVQRHFLNLYASRDRQCKLGYDSSAACDSFHLGQMLKFLTSKRLLFLVDFSPDSLESVPDTRQLDMEELIATLRQFPNYQVDRHHTNCGPQIRIKPIMDYICTMLSANVIAIQLGRRQELRRAERFWPRPKAGDNDHGRTFAFTRSIANDKRLHHDGVFHIDGMARDLFTAESWDWTPEA